MFGCTGKWKKQILVIMNTILSHLYALLGKNENSVMGNFSVKSQMMIFPYWRSRWVLFSQCTHRHLMLLPSQYPTITCLRIVHFRGNCTFSCTAGQNSATAPVLAKHLQKPLLLNVKESCEEVVSEKQHSGHGDQATSCLLQLHRGTGTHFCCSNK